MDLDPDPAIFVNDLQDAKKNYFVSKFFCLILFEGTFTSFFKDKKSQRSHKTVGIKVFLYFCLMIEGSGAGYTPLTNGPKTYRSNNTAFYNFFQNLEH
jgi:hypothetical protein